MKQKHLRSSSKRRLFFAFCALEWLPSGISDPSERSATHALVEGRYVSLGTDDKIEFDKAVKFIKAVLPEAPDGVMRKQEILGKRTGTDQDISASTIDRALA